MIKLIACDLDGTLVKKNDNTFADGVPQALQALIDSGRTVAFASGRSYAGMRRLAESLPFADDLYYICDDGALCVYRDKVLYHKQIPIGTVLRFVREPNYTALPKLFFADRFSYVLDSTPEILKALAKSGVDKLDPIGRQYEIREPIFKLGVCGMGDAPKMLVPEPFELRVAYRGGDWLEYVSRFASKGMALSDLQARLYLSKFDTASLGDGDNDVDMFAKSKVTFAKSDGSRVLSQNATDAFDNAAEALEKILYL